MPTTPPRILIVDDNATNRRLAEVLVERLGHVAVGVADGTAALSRLAEEPLDLVLLDAMMPGLDGPAVAREVRRREAAAGSPRIPIVAVTASVLPEDVARMLDAGMDDHLAKPLQAADLAEMLARRLPPAAARRANLIPPPASPPAAEGTAGGDTILDPEAIDRLADLGDPQLAERFVRLLLGDAAARLAEVDDAIATRDLPRLRGALRGLERICANLGAGSLGRRTRAIDDELRDREDRGEDPFARGLGTSELATLLDATRIRLEERVVSPRREGRPPGAGTSSRGCRSRR